MSNQERPGPTGRFPRGKLRPDDKGELNAGMAADPERRLVYIEFAVPVSWIAATPDECREFARMLNRKADQAEGKAP